jgi:hypothetical protein
MNPSRALFASLVLATLSCGGDPSDRPQDCSANEFFDETRELCQSCSALILPSCREGCAVLVSSDDRGCPVASCDLECATCPEGTSFSLETLACEPECPEGQAIHPLLGTCSACPVNASDPLECASQGCECELLTSLDELSCPRSSCGMCTNPSQGHTVDDAGLCVNSPGL